MTPLVIKVPLQTCLQKSFLVQRISVTRRFHLGENHFSVYHNPGYQDQLRPGGKRKPFNQLQSLRKKLNEHPEHVLRLLNLAENERLSNSEHIRLGSRGSLAVTRESSERSGSGMWYNFETNESGDMMDMVRKTKQFRRDQVDIFAR